MNTSVHIQILHFEQILDTQTNMHRVLISLLNYVLSSTQVMSHDIRINYWQGTSYGQFLDTIPAFSRKTLVKTFRM
jgi:ABC-type metal ion transport system substrate-binding protein